MQDAVHDAEGAKTTTGSRAPAPKTGDAEAPGPKAIGGPTRVSSESPAPKSCGMRARTGSLLSCRRQGLTQVRYMVPVLKTKANSAAVWHGPRPRGHDMLRCVKHAHASVEHATHPGL